MNITPMTELEITKAALAVGWVKFSYKKADGSHRIAIGTTNRSLIDAFRGYKMSEYRENKSYYDNCGYFDLSRCDWRQFNENRFCGLELDRLNNESAVAQAFAIVAVLDNNDEVAFNRIRIHASRAMSAVVVSEIEFRVTCRGVHTYANASLESARHEINEIVSHVAVAVPAVVVSVSKSTTAAPTAAPQANADRKALVAELMQLRQRESEILALLFA